MQSNRAEAQGVPRKQIVGAGRRMHLPRPGSLPPFDSAAVSLASQRVERQKSNTNTDDSMTDDDAVCGRASAMTMITMTT
eukprot:scaffold5171_cov126-Isochrysis_galbana.AAC.8